ncbi:hypothetical protein E2C01_069941 [Portunus trituberculatus]|uniref:Uncharacterized protein n=1 Tax=Portunus trituberculatus TaxID=210409 RepID=A0A5B7HRD3_PORTR|nr:hypothetical protein [Portunus trituberculatus]
MVPLYHGGPYTNYQVCFKSTHYKSPPNKLLTNKDTRSTNRSPSPNHMNPPSSHPHAITRLHQPTPAQLSPTSRPPCASLPPAPAQPSARPALSHALLGLL